MCGSILTNASGTFGVPIGDNKFEWLKQTDCIWIIAAPVGQTIVLEINSLNVENESGCLQVVMFTVIKIPGGSI